MTDIQQVLSIWHLLTAGTFGLSLGLVFIISYIAWKGRGLYDKLNGIEPIGESLNKHVEECGEVSRRNAEILVKIREDIALLKGVVLGDSK